jgi:hypothetical protein
LHWFDLDDFYKEVKRVLRKDDNGRDIDGSGIIAAWAYGLHSISPEIDSVTHLM